MAIRANLDALIANSTGLKKAFGESYRLKKHLERPMNVEIFGESFGLLKTEPKRMQNERMLIKANAIHLMQQGESDNTIKEKLAAWGNNIKIAVIKAWEALVGLITQLVRKVIGIRANARRTIKAIDTVLKRNVTKTDAIEVKLYSFPFDKKGMDNKNEGTKSYIDKKFDELTKMMDQVTPDSTPKLLSDEQIKTLKDDTKNEIRSKEQVAKNITATQAKAALRVERFILSMAEKTCDAAEKSEQEARKALKRIKDLYSDKKAKELSKNESEEAQAKKKEDFINKRKAAHQISQQITALSGATTAYYSAHITNAGRLMKVLKGGSETAKKENKDKKETKKEEAK